LFQILNRPQPGFAINHRLKQQNAGGWRRETEPLAQAFGTPEENVMAKGQKKSNKEARKPKKEKPKTIAASPSSKGSGGLSKG
jgi:hypothetical protein